MKKFLTIITFLILIPMAFLRAEDKDKINSVQGVWLAEGGNVKFKVYEREGKIYGSIHWIKKVHEGGQVMLDHKNPNPSLRGRNVVGMEVLKGFEYTGKNTYKNGTIYDPESGKTYKCLINLDGDIARVRGYIGIPLLGKTVECTRVSE